MENKVKQCKHNVKLAFNNDEIISYCDKCGKILDVYKKVSQYTTSPQYLNGIQQLTTSGTNGVDYSTLSDPHIIVR